MVGISWINLRERGGRERERGGGRIERERVIQIIEEGREHVI